MSLSLGLGMRPVSADCAAVFKYGSSGQSITVTLLGTGGAVLKAVFDLSGFVPNVSASSADSLRNPADSLRIDLTSLDTTVANAKPITEASFIVTPDGSCRVVKGGPCSVATPILQIPKRPEGAAQDTYVWRGTVNASFAGTNLADAGSDAKPTIHHVGIVVSRRGAILNAVDRNVPDPFELVVAYDGSSDIYKMKPNVDATKILDGIGAFTRSRIGFDATQNWTSSIRASAGVGQAASDQSANAKQVGDDILKGGGAADEGSKGGFLITDSGAFAFPDITAAMALPAFRAEALKKDIGDAGGSVTPFNLSRIIAPDGAMKLVYRGASHPGQKWTTSAGFIYGTAFGDDPSSVSDGALAIMARSDRPGASTAVSLAYAVANRIQNSTDFVNGPFLVIDRGHGVTQSIPIPSPRPVHAIDEGLQISDQHDRGFSTYLRATVEPGRIGNDLFGALQWSLPNARTIDYEGLHTIATRYSVIAGWRGTGDQYIAPIGTAIDLSGTRGPFYAVYRGSLSIAPGRRRETSAALYQSRWSDRHGVQRYTTRVDGLVDFENRLGVTGTGTLAAASLELLTREATHAAIPLTVPSLVPQRQGSIGLSWRPPNADLSILRGYAFETDCANIGSTPLAPSGLPKGTILPACVPIGRATFTGSVRFTWKRLVGAAIYGVPTAVERTPAIGGALQRSAAIRYALGCHIIHAAYTNRGGYDGLTDVAGSTYGVSLELHNVARLFGKRQIVTLSYSGSTQLPLGGVPKVKHAPSFVPDLLHKPDADGC